MEKEEEKLKAAATIDVDAMHVDEEQQSTHEPKRQLKPVAKFSSFTLWHADHPVIENQDEYYRSLHEWTGLAAAVHLGDDEELEVKKEKI